MTWTMSPRPSCAETSGFDPVDGSVDRLHVVVSARGASQLLTHARLGAQLLGLVGEAPVERGATSPVAPEGKHRPRLAPLQLEGQRGVEADHRERDPDTGEERVITTLKGFALKVRQHRLFTHAELAALDEPYFPSDLSEILATLETDL